MEAVTLYRAPTTVADADAIGGWLDARVDATVSVRDRFLSLYGDSELAESFARARVLSPYDRETGNTMLGIVRYEERALESPERAGGVIYDGLAVQRALHERIPESERSLEHLHVPLLDRVVGTWGDHDGRWHKRVTVLGQPGVVSVPGLYEAPAKPEQYYREQQKHALLSGGTPPREVLETEVEGEFLVDDDPRTTTSSRGTSCRRTTTSTPARRSVTRRPAGSTIPTASPASSPPSYESPNSARSTPNGISRSRSTHRTRQDTVPLSRPRYPPAKVS